MAVAVDLRAEYPSVLHSVRRASSDAFAIAFVISGIEDVADGGLPVRERQLVLAIAESADGEGMAPLDYVWGDRVEHALAQGRAVDLGMERARVPIGVRDGGAEDARAVAVPASVTLWAGVSLELLFEVVLAQGAQPCVVPEVEGAAEVAARGEAGLALVERRRDSALWRVRRVRPPALPLMIAMRGFRFYPNKRRAQG